MALKYTPGEVLQKNEADKLFKKISAKIFSGTSLPDILYHYTNTQGFFGITESDELWLSHVAYMNDYSELSYGINLIKRVIHSMKEELEKRNIYKWVNFSNESVSSLFESTFQPYIICFSEKGNLLSQWRAYGECGFSLGFKANFLKSLRLVNQSIKYTQLALRRVIYEEKKQINIVKEILHMICECYDRNIVEQLTEQEATNNPNYVFIFSILIDAFVDIITWFKHPSFAEENEWRLIYQMFVPPINDGHELFTVRVKGNNLVPYIAIDNNEEKLPLTKVFHGPSQNTILTMKALNYRLSQKKYINVETIGANIPLRSSI
jgi:hypothetical protein